LRRLGDTLFQATENTAPLALTTAGLNGAGRVLAGALEASNVDVAEQFVRLIEGQRGFQASARVITASDELVAEALDLLR
jgi:flagellar hook protein FlgE